MNVKAYCLTGSASDRRASRRLSTADGTMVNSMPARFPHRVPATAQGDDMPRVKKIVLWILVAFAIYAIFTSPDRAADIVRTSGSILVDGAKGIGQFFDALLRR